MSFPDFKKYDLNAMTEQDYRDLEYLIGKLRRTIGYDFCLTYPVIQDGYHIGIYNLNGELQRNESGPRIQEVVKKLN